MLTKKDTSYQNSRRNRKSEYTYISKEIELVIKKLLRKARNIGAPLVSVLSMPLLLRQLSWVGFLIRVWLLHNPFYMLLDSVC